jgi:hypothetical protein
MRLFARFGFVSLVTGLLCADAQRVIMPKEIGVSCLKHKPFTAAARTTLTRVFSSGTRGTVTTEDRIARDGQGRVLSEQHLPRTEDPAHPVYYINLLDPRAMERIHIDPQAHIVSKRPVDKRLGLCSVRWNTVSTCRATRSHGAHGAVGEQEYQRPKMLGTTYDLSFSARSFSRKSTTRHPHMGSVVFKRSRC